MAQAGVPLPEPPPPAQPPALRREAGRTLAMQLAEIFTSRIHAGQLGEGVRLPSVRDCAQRFGVSMQTVVAAYDVLQARGLTQVQAQRGFFVRVRAQAAHTTQPAVGAYALQAVHPSPLPHSVPSLMQTLQAESPPQASRLSSHHQRAMQTEHAGRPATGAGVLPAEWHDASLLARAMRRTLNDDAQGNGVGYGHPQGDSLLRQQLQHWVAERGIVADPAHMVTSVGVTHALDMVARTLFKPGDAVLVDAPGWSLEFARLSRMGLRLLSVPRSGQGLDLDTLARLAQQHQPKAYCTMSVLHNPTGHSITATEAHRVLQLATAHDFYIIEDDTFAAFAPAHSPRYAALDGLQRTFYVAGFSKVLAAGWRVGAVLCPAPWVQAVLEHKLIAGLNSPTVTERALGICLEQGWLRRHALSLQQRLVHARTRCARLAAQHGFAFAAKPVGLFGWLETHVDTERLAQRMLDHGWHTSPGHMYYPEPCTSTRLRLNYANALDPAFWRCLQLEQKALAKMPS